MTSIQTRRLSGARKVAVLALLSPAALFAAHAGPAAASPYAFQACPSGALCLYKSKNLNAATTQKPDAIYKKCQVVNLKGWTSRHGSYLNNQTGPIVTTFFAKSDGRGKALRRMYAWPGFGYKTGQDNNYDFYPVNSIRVC